MITITELFERLKEEDEVILIDKLGVTSSDIVDHFQDVIEDKFEELSTDYEEEVDD